MIEYIYIVKCPGCEDEMFNFFTDARMQCDLLMSKKPSITQVEVERNDFGECTDSHDLGTVWSWEEAMKDTEGGYTDAEPAKSIFTKDDLKDYIPDNDPEFDDIDNSVDCELEEPETSEVSPVERKPIPEGMTIEELVEEMEENEDTVECVGCEELYPKEDCTFNKEIGWLCGDCEDSLVKCNWCDELYDKSECRYEVDLGWLCSRCEMAIKSRGETLTFREGNYWDFLDESVDDTRSLADLVKDSINHLVNDIGRDSSAEDFVDDVIADIENNYDIEVPKDLEKYRDWASVVASEVSRQLNNQPQLDEKLDLDFSNCVDSSDMEIWGVEPIGEATYKAVLMKRYENVSMRGYDESQKVYDEMYDVDGLFTFSFGKDTNPQLDAWNVHLLNKLGQCEIIFDDERYDQACEKALNGHSSKLEELEPEVVHDLGNEYDGGYPSETPEVSDSHLKLCPECGKETFDIETGICVDCGFN